MQTDLDAPAPPALTPTGDPFPVELAVIDSIASGHEPETLLRVVFYRPDGGASIRYAWTAGGPELGDRIDRLALAAGLDFADWLDLTEAHCDVTTRGRIEIQAYALRPILADVTSGCRAPDERREGLQRILRCAAETTGQTPRPGFPRWYGVGPTLLTSYLH
ncbi:hypothetical protein [[Kitasatospora] papulosa]|uniref:hypothetical protein n=1 Tax=[Kitasatospora] papulosa TaxID=1464011 RepID=UPI0036C430EA